MKKFKTGLFLFSLIIVSVCVNGQVTVKKNEKDPMAAKWKQVQQLIDKQLPQSAIAEVKKIYAQAKKEKQQVQVIKSLVYLTELQDQLSDDQYVFSVKDLEKEITTSQEPYTSILNNLLAENYWRYYQQHRWNFYNRTQTVNFVKEDIATWGAEDFHKKISELFLASVKNEKLLKQAKLEPFDAILVKGNSRYLRPTLFDLLAHRAIDYFENDERDINKPAYAFEIDQAAAYDPAADFITRKFITRDSLSLHHKALLLYQQLIAFHLSDARPDALIDADIKRIQFVHNKSVHPDKDQLYFNAINHIAHQYERLPAAAQAWYLLAAYYEQKAASYQPYGDSTHRLDRVKAKEICESVLTQKDTSEGFINCYNLLASIREKSLQFSMEKVNLPGQAFRSLVTYRNIPTLYLRIIRPDEKIKKDLENQYDEKYWASLISAPSLKSWQQALPATNDYQPHKVEIKIEALPAGEYILLASSGTDLKNTQTALGAHYFYVSSISFVNNDNDYFVLNRDNGRPLTAATVQVWEQRYDYTASRYTRQKGNAFTTDANGFFRMSRKNQDNRYNYVYQLDITHNGERLFMNDLINTYYQRGNEQEPKTTTSAHLFIDRSLYRPGQTVYFKGIVLASNTAERKNNPLTGYENVIYLLNANRQRIDSMNVKTNEYGSFSGKFQLPGSGLNGQFSLQLKKDQGGAYFNVEEYKRPKFDVSYEPLKGTYKVNEKIKITGIAKAYAGNNIDGATVSYRVIRQPRFLYPWLYRRWWLPSSEPLEIIHGETKTNAEGKFTVEFTAIPDLKIDKKFEPVFDYIVYADVTDINGETRSGNQTVSVSYKALILKTDIPSAITPDSLKNLSIRTENMNGEFEPATVTVTFTKLKEEKRLIRDRYWERPDQFILTKEEYIRYFPYDEYDNETDYLSWEKGEKVWEKKDSSASNGQWAIDNRQLTTGNGFYIIEITAVNKSGEEVKDIRYIEIYDENNNQLSRPQYLWTASSDPIEPGQSTSVKLGTSAENLFVVQQVNRQVSAHPANSTYQYFTINRERRKIDFTASEADRGGYGVNWIFVKHNRFYQFADIISVPWTNKQLKIEYATYRDKTLPGSQEKWKLKISGYKNDKIAAEMLASMYDASLDQFYPHQWSAPSVWPVYFSRNAWNSSANFTRQESNQRWTPRDNAKYFSKTYDRLLTSIYQNAFAHDMNAKARYADGRAGGFIRAEMSQAAPMANEMMKLTPGVVVDTVAFADGREDKFDFSATAQSPQGSETQIRKNFNETAFFFPDLRTDSTGSIEFSFTLPEALTKWKFQALSHTKEAAFGYSYKEIVTQKELMVQPNAPRFFREGDKMEFSSKVVNLTANEMKGQAELQLFDAATNQPVDNWFKHTNRTQAFTVPAGQSVAIGFPIEIPSGFNKALVWRIVAKAGTFSDGEENTMPVLTNRMLVTETLPLWMNGTGTKNFSFDKLLRSSGSTTLQHHALTVEYTSNPAWYAVQALPYLMEYPFDCAEQTWNRYYANSLATFLANSTPRLKAVFESWSNISPDALLSNLQKNEELKSILLEETPWVLQAKSEAEQKKNIALLFDMVRMSRELNSSFDKLQQMQSPNGGFVWFKGGPDDRYMTQYIVTGIGHLAKLKGIAPGQEAKLKQLLATAIPYLDKKIKEDYDNLVKNKVDLTKYAAGYSEIQYLYMRSFFPEYKIPVSSQKAYTYFRGRIQQNWTNQNKYMQGMIVLALGRTGDLKTPAAILKSLKETSLYSEEMGRYWKDARRGWWWYEAPIERQALLIEAFQETGKDIKTADELRTWLLKNKQTNRWESTKATAEACYALLIQGSSWLTNEPVVTIQLGNTTISSADEKQETGTGYFKKSIEGEKVNAGMGNIAVTVSSGQGVANNAPNWGGVYWQYFEDLDKITTAATPLNLVKKLFVETNSDRGPVLSPVNNGSKLKVGDKIKVRIELRVDRDMEYVHMKDMRASCLEPVNVLSGYKWQSSLGYYESTRDASTNFFFSNLRKGTYVFEYPLFVTHTGDFSNGITSIQSMYAPEFSSHSEGVRISVSQ